MKIKDIKVKHVVIGLIILIIICLIGQSITNSKLEEKRQIYFNTVKEGLSY